MRRAATISAAKMALCVINIIPPAWAQDRPDVVDRSTEDTNHHVSQQTTWPQFRGHLIKAPLVRKRFLVAFPTRSHDA